MTRASARGTGIWDQFGGGKGGEAQQGAGLCRKSKVFWNRSECCDLSLSGK